jgi:hypothetical protein
MSINSLHKAFRGLYSDMRRSFSACNLDPPTVQVVDSLLKLPLPDNMRQKLLSSNEANLSMDYFPKEIQHHILNEQSVAVTYTFSVGDRKMNLHFVVFNERKSDLNMSKMLERAKRVCALMHLVSLHASRSTCSATLQIYIYMTDFKKRFPDKAGEALDAEHANTGMSYHCAKTNDIVVYRKEEWFKVLIHELFHAFGLSFIESDMPDGVDAAMQAMLKQTYAISHTVRVYETYCEIWARILNVVFACFADGEPGNHAGSDVDFAIFGECVLKGLHKDAEFALHQCAKIMQHMDIPASVMLNPTKDNRAMVTEKYRENTNVFAYYVMTCALQHSPDVFLAWCHKNNPKGQMLQFRTILSNFNGFMEMLFHCKHRCPIPGTISEFHRVIPSSSMRMTMPNATE